MVRFMQKSARDVLVVFSVFSVVLSFIFLQWSKQQT